MIPILRHYIQALYFSLQYGEPSTEKEPFFLRLLRLDLKAASTVGPPQTSHNRHIQCQKAPPY